MLESSSLLAFGIFLSTCGCIIAVKTLNIFLVQERQNPGRRWIGCVLLCHIWLQRRGSIACGICAPKEFVMCVIKPKSSSLPFSPGDHRFLVAAHVGITDPSLFSLKSKLVRA